jgi:DNA-binding MarR family transcriptional regulator
MNARDWLASDEGQAWIAYQRGSQLIERMVDQALRASADLSHSDFQILARLADAPGRRVRMGALAEMLIAPKSRLNYQIGQLADRGLVTREPHPGDRRGLDAVLTPAGLRQFLRAVPGLLATVRGQLIPLLDKDELAQLGAIMTRVAEHIEQCGERPLPLPPRS